MKAFLGLQKDMKNQHGVDLDLVRQNAAKDGIPLSEITLFYEGLTQEEFDGLLANNLSTHQTPRVVMARFMPTGDALFPEKVAAVYCLAAY